MGHRGASEEQCGARRVFRADRGVSAPDSEAVGTPPCPGRGQRVAAPAVAAHRLHVRAALFALRVYQTHLSVLFAGSCRFHPTCSQYTCEAIARFGLARGSWLALRRLLRCHPLSRSFGFDPVPEQPEIEEAGLQAGATNPCAAHAAAAAGRSAVAPNEVRS